MRERANHSEPGVLALITARGGSKRLPGKNVAIVAGRPLIAWSIDAARSARHVTRVIVDTDDPHIAQVARQWGAEVPYLRPAELARDESPSMDVVLHALRWLDEHEGYRPTWLCLLQPTSPLRLASDIDAAIELAMARDADAVVSVTPSHHHPLWQKQMDAAGCISDYVPAASRPSRSQDLPPAYALDGSIYLARPAVLIEHRTWYTPRTCGYVMPAERSVDVDAAWDLERVDRLLSKRTACGTILIGSREVGPGQPCYVIAEAGVNHNGDVAMALQLIDAAADAGADAVKFQTFRADAVAAVIAPKAEYQKRTTSSAESQQAMLRKLELSRDDHARLIDHCNTRGITFLSTPFDPASVDMLVDLGVPALKVPSGEVTNRLLLEHVAGKRLPVILSTGMCDLDEVRVAVDILRRGTKQIAVLHCVTNYPADPSDVNLRAMATLRDSLQLPIGYSDHTAGTHISLAAAAMGACIIEKHLTLDRTLPGPDHAASLEPAELRSMIHAIRTIEAALGDGVKRPAPCELPMRPIARRSLVAACDIPPGSVIQRHMLTALRPGTGLSPMQLDAIIGRPASSAIRKGDIIPDAA